MAPAKDNIREERISMEAIVDAYGHEERAMGCYYYLKDKLKFAFKARCRSLRAISALKLGEEVEVLGMAPEDECQTEMFVWIGRAADRIAVPLAQLRPLSKDQDTQEAVRDWLYWVDRVEQAQIREHVRNLKEEGERAQFLMDRAQAGDVRVVDACLNASPWLSGLTPERAASILEFARSKMCPREYQERETGKAILEHLKSVGGTFVAAYRKIAVPLRETPADKATKRIREGVS